MKNIRVENLIDILENLGYRIEIAKSLKKLAKDDGNIKDFNYWKDEEEELTRVYNKTEKELQKELNM